MALLRKRLDELRRMSLEIRSTSILMDNADLGTDEEIRRIVLSLSRLERELRRLQKRNEKLKEETYDRRRNRIATG